MSRPAPAPADHPASDATLVQTDHARETSRRLSQRDGSVPASVGGYEILRCIGEGSFGTVWLGREKRTGRQVAIKFFAHRRGLDWSLLTREVEKLAALDASRDVVRLLDVGIDHDPPYFVMEYLPQRSVANLLDQGPLPVAKAVEIARGVARALVHAHSAGILHCDIKPGNVLLDQGAEARLGDFGQSRLVTEQSASLGTFYYMAPEQARRDAIPDVRWDVYALGALLFHMLTGAPPYKTEEREAELRAAPNLEERLAAYRRMIDQAAVPAEHRDRAQMDAQLVRLIDECLERDPAQRLSSAQAFLDRLDRRELQHARRPLVALGFLGPVLFMLALLWISSRVVPGIVREAESHLSTRALDSDSATVRLLAASLEQELAERQAELEQLARLLPAAEGQPEWYGLRDDYDRFITAWKEEIDERYNEQQRTLDESLFLCDRDGVQVFRDPRTETIGRSYTYRDYFHGLGRELTPQETTGVIKPRETPGVSVAFRSTNTGQFMVAIAVPVWNHAHNQVVGVLARTLHLTDLLDQWKRRIGEKERLLTLVDMRENPPLILNHDWLTEERSRGLGNESRMRELLRLTPVEEKALTHAVGTAQGITNYADPLADQETSYAGPWLAAVAKTTNVNWIAIVQERQQEAVAPMTNLYGMFLRYGLLTLLVFALLLILLWWLIQRAAES